MRVGGVRESPVVDELGADDDVLAGLPSRALRLEKECQQESRMSETSRNIRSRSREMPIPLHKTVRAKYQLLVYKTPTLYVIADFAEGRLRSKLNLMRKHVASGCRPVCPQTVIASDPLCTDVGIDLNAVSVAIVGSCGNRVVRKWKRLVHKVRGFYRAEEVDGQVDRACGHDKCALCRCELEKVSSQRQFYVKLTLITVKLFCVALLAPATLGAPSQL